MRVLIVGGTGFIGPWLVRRLAAAGHRVAVFHRGPSLAELPAGVEEISGDRDRLASHAAELRRFAPEVVVHLIAYVEAHARALIQVFRGVARRTVFISSGDVYRSYGVFHGTEEGPLEPVPAGEDAPLRRTLYPYRSLAKGPDDFAYSYDKIPVERAALSDPTLPGTVLRLPMVYGPGDPQHRLSGYLKHMADGRPVIPLAETLAGWRCTRGYVDDVAAAIALAVADERAAGRTYNVGEAVAHTEADWVRAIGAAVGWTGKVVPVPDGPVPAPGNYLQDVTAETKRIRTELGYQEVASAEVALTETIRSEIATLPPGLQVD